MIPNLFAATQEYWHQLDILEKQYQNGDVSIAEVDARVAQLMTELADERRLAFRSIGYALQGWLNLKGDVIFGIFSILLLAYFWYFLNFSH